MIRKTGAILLIALLAFTAAACGGSGSTNGSNASPSAGSASPSGSESSAAASPSASASAEKVKLRIYAQYADEDTKLPYDYAVAELKKEMPNVELELDIQAQDDGQKLKTYAATGNLPDIYQAGLDIINTFKQSGNIQQLDEYADKFGFKDAMQPSAMNTLVTDDGHIYAFPYAGNEMILLYYNKELFEKFGVKVPTTFDEWKTAVETFKKNGIIPLSMFAKEKWPDVALYDVFASRLDPAGITKLDKGQAKASDPAYKTAAEKLAELVKAGLLAKGATNMNYDQAAALFYEGKAAMFLNGQWEIEASTKALGDKVAWMFYPGMDAAGYESSKLVFSGGGGPGGYAVNPKSEHVELAAQVAAFMSRKYAEFKYTERGTPIVATKVDKPIVKQYPPMMQELAKVIPDMKSTAFAWGLSNPKFKAAIEDASQSLLAGTSAEQFVKEVDKAIGQ
ncbi:extracellular solute-binding protein [Cohnella sp. CFH 77786]|uniref:ABC transporter substrate-binding protein n=1 Tax=Cohnella sp. CFH 77786 TaxID=2662265 RepID=UPI001C60ABCC|nr:extracellular solute-binding protein [Cohnella sp. CFH 77786]MBW5449284.1 extracellular solute-binding protein [Cohnella sp. CFH 77786]